MKLTDINGVMNLFLERGGGVCMVGMKSRDLEAKQQSGQDPVLFSFFCCCLFVFLKERWRWVGNVLCAQNSCFSGRWYFTYGKCLVFCWKKIFLRPGWLRIEVRESKEGIPLMGGGSSVLEARHSEPVMGGPACTSTFLVSVNTERLRIFWIFKSGSLLVSHSVFKSFLTFHCKHWREAKLLL